ncbi:ribonuclease J [Fictibacillus sp. Mic-4]|uniref:ribonuclease J n=1 Tax=Fictibacillus TaxID=1329200 RepID=UPI000412A7FD|nr:ribonuclease J [Fictibacillus gelatini]
MTIKQNIEKVRVFALGGVGEIGKNMYVVEVNEDIFVLDAGLMFPHEEMLGIDIVIPDITYLTENLDRVQGIFLTHAHEDHIGALPFILKKLPVSVFGTKFTLGLVESKLKEAGIFRTSRLQLIDSNTVLTFNHAKISFFGTNHSIPDSVGIAVHTSQGVIVNTGDFKIDHTPIDGSHTEFSKITELASKGVLCLLSDSTNAERPGMTGSERTVGIEINDCFYKAKGRIIIASFASNIHRIQQVMNAAILTNRKVAISGRSMVKYVDIAIDLGYLQVEKDIIVSIDDINNYADERVVILTTGSQGEPMAALSRMASNSHKQVSIKKTDTVIIAATPIPGNEMAVSKIVDRLMRTGAEVVFGQRKVHVSGHGSQEELKLMINLIKPKYFLPVHGEFRMQKAHQSLAIEVGVQPENIFILEKGEVVEFTNGEAKRFGKVPAGNVLVDGLGVGDIGNIVLRDRKLLSQDGILVVVVTISKVMNQIVSGPEIISRGFVYVRESEELLKGAGTLVKEVLEKCMTEKVKDWSSLKSNIRDSLSYYLFEKTKRRPMIMPIIMEI